MTLIIGTELIKKLKESDINWGYIRGFSKEGVIGAYSANIGEKNPIFCQASFQIYDHKLFLRGYKDDALLWGKVSNEFIKKDDFLEIPISELKTKFSYGLYTRLYEKKINYILLIGETDKDFSFSTVFKDEKEGNFIFLPSDIQLLDEKPNPYKRIDGLVPIRELNNNKVAIIGVGSGGSFISLELAAAGVGKLYLFDKDVLTIDNIFRHACDGRDLGRKKVDALEDAIKGRLFHTEVVKNNEDILKNPQNLIDAINEADLIICATDNVKSREFVNYLAVCRQKPLILVCTFDKARIGEVIKIIPKVTACYECTRMHQREQGSILPIDNGDEEVVPYSSQIKEKDNRSIGTRTDVFLVAALAAKVALMTLTESDQIFGRIPYNYITWGSVKNTDFNPPFSFLLPFTTNYCNYGIHPNCPICGDLPIELKDINIEERYNEIMAELSSK